MALYKCRIIIPGFDLRLSNITDKAARALCGLKTIRAHGLTGESIHDVTRATYDCSGHICRPGLVGISHPG